MGGVTYERYAWDPASGKPWTGDAPLDTGTLTDLLGGINVFSDTSDPYLFDGTKPLDAALCTGDPYTVHLFQGSQCYRVSVARATGHVRNTDTQARPIKDVFGYDFNSNGGEFPFPSVDAALYSPTDNKIWFFSGANCESFDADTFKPDHWKGETGGWGSYNPAIATTWTGLPAALDNGISWATTKLTDSGEQNSGCLVKDTTWCPVTLSTTTANMALFTEPGDHTYTVPAGVDTLSVELWGPGGWGGDGGATCQYGPGGPGGNGGPGVYLRDSAFPAAQGQTLTISIGKPGEYTSLAVTSESVLIAPGGGGGGGGGSDGGGAVGGAGGGDGGGDGRVAGMQGYGGHGSTGNNPYWGGSGAGAGDYGQGNGAPGSGGAPGADGVGGQGGGGGAGAGGGVGGGGGVAQGGYGSNGGGGDGGGVGGGGGGGGPAYISGGTPSAGGVGGGGGGSGQSGGGGGGGAGFGGHGAGGGGGAAAGGGGGGSAGKPLVRDANVTTVDYGSGTAPGGQAPGGIATGGTGGATDAPGTPGTSGGARILW
ncbi:hypothetical protein ACIBKX_33720 [Streptomyces sp. NPDC050658]|uniref:hypothetical protein n=1 Tax=unclassified Streptomyces TaxID=2593676 RepID=UPI003420FC78